MDPTSSAPDRAPRSFLAAALLSARHLLRTRAILPRLFARGPDEGRDAARRLLDARAELGHAALAGRVDLGRLRGEAAEPYLQGLDVIECRSERLFEVHAARARYGARNPWRLSPRLRAARKLPDTPAGRRQREWLDLLARAGLINRP